jgi:hypothetical protein
MTSLAYLSLFLDNFTSATGTASAVIPIALIRGHDDRLQKRMSRETRFWDISTKQPKNCRPNDEKTAFEVYSIVEVHSIATKHPKNCRPNDEKTAFEAHSIVEAPSIVTKYPKNGRPNDGKTAFEVFSSASKSLLSTDVVP